jgi:hypothetical protein
VEEDLNRTLVAGLLRLNVTVIMPHGFSHAVLRRAKYVIMLDTKASTGQVSRTVSLA